jgi:hypothetical protein
MRIVLLPVTLIAWAALVTCILLVGSLPVAALFSLSVLLAGFEAIHALHVGVERIGRYIQVYYEADSSGARWETTAMAVGPALPGGGIDPLFTVVFVAATVLNMIPALVPLPSDIEVAIVTPLHLLFIVRVVRARGAAARQRAVELESFRGLRAQPLQPKP